MDEYENQSSEQLLDVDGIVGFGTVLFIAATLVCEHLGILVTL